MSSGLKIFSGNSNTALATKVAEMAGVPLGSALVQRFSDGEVRVEIGESVRGARCFVVQSTCPPVNENYMELFMMLDALRRASPSEVVCVLPYYGYSRQDYKIGRAPISAKCLANLMHTAGAQRLVCVDLHSPQTQGFFDGPVDLLLATRTLAKAWTAQYGQGRDIVAVSPDAGGASRCRLFAKYADCSIAIVDKRRPRPNQAEVHHIVGKVRDKVAVILDDLIDTAGTVVQAARALRNKGAKRVFVVATHAILSDPAVERLSAPEVEKIMITDTIALSKAAQASGKFEIVSVAPLIAKAIQRIHSYDSLSALLVD